MNNSEEQSPLVSIVIPCYGGSRYLPQAIESCLSQTHAHLEIIVVDDASPDNCAEIAEKYAAKDKRLRLIRKHQNGGVSAALNTGFSSASGSYFCRLAQDDVFRRDAVEIMLREFNRHADAGLVYCDEQVIDESGKVVEMLKRPEPEEALKDGNKIGLGVMWTRKVWDAIGGFNSTYDTVEDYDYWLRLRQHSRIYHCAEPALFFRIHSQMGSKVFSVKQELLMAELAARDTRSALQKRQILALGYFNAGYNAGQQRSKSTAIRLLLKSIQLWPFRFKAFKRLGYSLLMK